MVETRPSCAKAAPQGAEEPTSATVMIERSKTSSRVLQSGRAGIAMENSARFSNSTAIFELSQNIPALRHHDQKNRYI
jgi:hypothetical protein